LPLILQFSLWITLWITLWIKNTRKVIHKLYTGYPQGYPQDNLLILKRNSELSTENAPLNNNNLYYYLLLIFYFFKIKSKKNKFILITDLFYGIGFKTAQVLKNQDIKP